MTPWTQHRLEKYNLGILLPKNFLSCYKEPLPCIYWIITSSSQDQNLEFNTRESIYILKKQQ